MEVLENLDYCTTYCIQNQSHETMKNYLALLEVVERLREKEEAKVEVRGKEKLGSQAEEFLKKRNAK